METHHQEYQHSVESGDHHEKKPVLKKVKEKVKKIKNTISKKRHGHGEEHEHGLEHEHYGDFSEEEDEYEEEEEPEVHGAPIYESAAAKNLVSGRDAMGMPTAAPEMGFGSKPMYPLVAEPTAYEKPHLVTVGGMEELPAAPKHSIRAPATATQSQAYNPSTVYERPAAARNVVGGLQDENLGPGMVGLGRGVGMTVEDQAVPKNKPIYDDDESRLLYPLSTEPTAYEKPHLVTVGGMDELPAAAKHSIGAPATATQSQGHNPSTVYERPAAARNVVGGLQDENMGPGMVDMGRGVGMTVEDPAVPKNKPIYDDDESRLLYPLSADTAASEKQDVGLKEGIYGGSDVGLEEDPGAPKGSIMAPSVPTQQTHASYPSTGTQPRTRGDEVESPLLSSFQAMSVSDSHQADHALLDSPPTGTHDQFSSEKPRPQIMEEETEQGKTSSYTDKITSTAAAAKDAAVSAAVGSTEYGKKIATTVYDKVSGASTAITGKGSDEPRVEDTVTAAERGGQPDKGVSVKDYIVGKLKPRNEDRALSEVISEAVYTDKQDASGTHGAANTNKQDASGTHEAANTNKQDASGTHEAAKGASSEGGGGKGMVDKIKGAVTSWIGAGSVAGPRASPTPDTRMKGETTTTTGTVESRDLGEKMQ